MSGPAGAVRVSVHVAVPLERAFSVFTDDIGDWYVVDANTVVDASRTRTLTFEPFVGGRFLDVYDEAAGTGREIGRIVAWEPPNRLQFVDGHGCDVEVTFVAAGGSGTQVTVEQRGIELLPPDEAASVREHGWPRTLPHWYQRHVRALEGATMSNTTGTTTEVTLGTIVPYLFYDDAEAMLEWYARVFGFVELGRWHDGEGRVQNAEMSTGSAELWMDGGGRRALEADGKPFSPWIGVWVDDVDAMHAKIQERGVECEEPVDKPYGVRTFAVRDPEGYHWGFMRRI